MAKLVLYGVPVSAFVAKARIVLDLKRLDYEELPPPGGYGSEAYRAIVPAGSIPGLTVDGVPLHDSTAIAEYLDEIAPEPPLMPDDAFARARIRALAGFHDTRVEAAARAMFPLVKRARTEEEAEAGAAGFAAALDRLDTLVTELPAGPFLGGDRLTLADCAYPCTIRMGEMLCGELGRDVAAPPRIADWMAALAEVPAVARSLEIHREAMTRWLDEVRP
jgi:glutathione S-transferase